MGCLGRKEGRGITDAWVVWGGGRAQMMYWLSGEEEGEGHH